MRHLPTYCQWIVRKFGKETGKRCIATFSNRMIKTIGTCIRWQCKEGIGWEIRLNLNQIKRFKPEMVRDFLLHECAHTTARGHGKRFQNVCQKMHIDLSVRRARAQKDNFIDGGNPKRTSKSKPRAMNYG